jgi:tetratricopeptide (TPR) repeat protein
MSLCDLAQYAKQLGDYELQRDLSVWATGEDPADPWPHAQAGDALRLLGQFEQAFDEYHRAGAAGDERVALLGRAEVLKDLGQVAEALQVYDRCAELYPTDLVCKNGKAAALATFGRLEEALESYDDILAGVALDSVTMGGRAQVLRDLGRIDEALRQVEDVSTVFQDEPVIRQMQAEMYRDLGRFEEALAILDRLIERTPIGVRPRNSRARVLRDMGRYDMAAAEFRQLIADFPKDSSAYIGLAEVLRKAGRVPEAIEAYQMAASKFARMGAVRTGLAAVLASQGEYSEAMKLLPTDLPATQSEWVAYHIRSMIYLRSKEFSTASSMLEWGVATTPWASQRRYFETALASLRIRQKRYESALDLLGPSPSAALHPIVEALRLHAYGEMGRREELMAAQRSPTVSASPVVVELRTELLRRFSSDPAATKGQGRGDDWVFQQECDSLLLAA